MGKCLFQLDCTIPAIQCGPPPLAPLNGLSSHTGTHFTDKARFSCEEGYRLEGNHVILCAATGEWGTPPTCKCKYTVSSG